MTFQYVDPRKVASSEGLFFYHSFDLPAGGTIKGDWDLRGNSEAYLGNVDFKGKRCLDVGTGSGFLSFKMEELGASEVVSFDIRSGSDWDVVPHFKLRNQMAEIRRKSDVAISRMKDSYWFCHNTLGSKAKVTYGNIYDIPEELGVFDVVFYGTILNHLRDPYWGLYNGARLSRDMLIITGSWGASENPTSTFRPNAARGESSDN